jgi:antitoxin CcdA
MKHDTVSPRKRRAVNLSLDADIVAASRDAGINISRVTEEALRVAVKAERERRWLEENRAAIESSNNWLRDHGLPFADLRVG